MGEKSKEITKYLDRKDENLFEEARKHNNSQKTYWNTFLGIGLSEQKLNHTNKVLDVHMSSKKGDQKIQLEQEKQRSMDKEIIKGEQKIRHSKIKKHTEQHKSIGQLAETIKSEIQLNSQRQKALENDIKHCDEKSSNHYNISVGAGIVSIALAFWLEYSHDSKYRSQYIPLSLETLICLITGAFVFGFYMSRGQKFDNHSDKNRESMRVSPITDRLTLPNKLMHFLPYENKKAISYSNNSNVRVEELKDEQSDEENDMQGISLRQ